MTNRKLKKVILEYLKDDDYLQSFEKILDFPPKKVINPLLSFFYNHDELIKWRSISATGQVVSKLANEGHLESARVIMRRLMWNLNDESGGIGWGSPEAMGDIIARHDILAAEFHKILISYLMPDGNFLEHEMLQRGLLWGIGRLSNSRPELFRTSSHLLLPFFQSKDPSHRGHAAWAAKPFQDILNPHKQTLMEDNEKFLFYNNYQLNLVSISQIIAGF